MQILYFKIYYYMNSPSVYYIFDTEKSYSLREKLVMNE